jgi:hypothetical protein
MAGSAAESKNQERFARCADEFISLMSVKETNQRKRFSRTHLPQARGIAQGFF